MTLFRPVVRFLAPILGALAFAVILLVLVGESPGAALNAMVSGAVGSAARIGDTLTAWTTLSLAAAGLAITFTAGLWNIGVEGQMIAGAIAASFVAREMSAPPAVMIPLVLMAGFVGGALWAALAGVLKVKGRVNEIFGGLGLDFVATALTLWLIFGPWGRPGVASMSGTEPFPDTFSLPALSGLRLSPWAVLLGVGGYLLVFLILQGTTFGLRLKAVGKNPRAAFLLGIPTVRYMLLAFVLCGGLGGAAGAVQVTAVYHRLIPSISSGYGYLGLMVAMLVNYQPLWMPLVAFFFAALNLGSIQLPIVLKLDSSLAGVLQGALVLFVLAVEGIRQRLRRPQAKAAE